MKTVKDVAGIVQIASCHPHSINSVLHNMFAEIYTKIQAQICDSCGEGASLFMLASRCGRYQSCQFNLNKCPRS